MNVVTEADVAQYEECIAFALSDRWKIDDLQFEILDDADGHTFICEGGDILVAKPTDIEFSVALQDAIANYRFFRSGYIEPQVQNPYWGGVFRPPVQSWLSDPEASVEDETAPEEN